MIDGYTVYRKEQASMELGERIKVIRVSLGETMEQFGERFNTSKGTVNNWEKGRNAP
ncbi:TPA: helix-turn-helix domain-containing protein, partial [Streptococcus suis]